MKNINAIIFDFGGVILNIDYTKTRNAFIALGVKDFDEMYSQKNANPLFSKLERGELSIGEFYSAFRQTTNLTATDLEIGTAWNAMLLDYRQEALKTLKLIRQKYKLFLLSNTNLIHYNAFNKAYQTFFPGQLLDDHFDKAYYSHQMGMRKPAKDIYEFVIRENKLDPSQTLFIDDSIQNIETAKALGLKTILLQEGQNIEELGL